METSRVGPIVRAISQACVLVCILSFTSGCREYSKEQQREIDAIKRRVTENPASIDHDDGHGLAAKKRRKLALTPDFVIRDQWKC